MKIVFICGSLEPGRDGVGDYVSRLAKALTDLGHEIGLIALNDRHITELIEGNKEGGNMPLMRLPELMDKREKQRLLNSWITAFNPEWLSLQYVPFSFDRKGLCFDLVDSLQQAGKGRKWQIMFHEVSVGLNIGCGMKARIWGLLQEHIVKRLLKVLKPSVVHTHNQVYRLQLERLGAELILLPLFSNIPVLDKAGIKDKIGKQKELTGEMEIVMFGGIHPGAPVEDFAGRAKVYAEATGRRLSLKIIGRSGQEQERWLNKWKSEGLEAELLGEQSEANISRILGNAHFGVFTTPLALVEKSGSVAAMREHGIHLLAVSPPWEPRNMKLKENPFGIKAFNNTALDTFFEGKADFSYMPQLDGIAEQFSVDLFKN